MISDIRRPLHFDSSGNNYEQASVRSEARFRGASKHLFGVGAKRNGSGYFITRGSSGDSVFNYLAFLCGAGLWGRVVRGQEAVGVDQEAGGGDS